MQKNKHKRKVNHVLIVASDAVDEESKALRLTQGGRRFLIFALCIILGVIIGYCANEASILSLVSSKFQTQGEQIVILENKIEELTEELKRANDDKISLEALVVDLQNQKEVISEALNEKTKTEQDLKEELEGQALPNEFPLNGSASIEVKNDDNPMVVFNSSGSTQVISAATGVVTAVNDDPEYGKNIWIDHGNGYITIYRNNGTPLVKEGDSVIHGTALFKIDKDNKALGYQMLFEGSYVDPMDMLAISG